MGEARELVALDRLGTRSPTKGLFKRAVGGKKKERGRKEMKPLLKNMVGKDEDRHQASSPPTRNWEGL